MKKFTALTLAVLLILSMTAVLPISAAKYEIVYDKDFSTYATQALATDALKTYWNTGSYNTLANATGILWSQASGFQHAWSTFSQVSTKQALSNYRFTAQIKTLATQWAAIAIRESLTKTDLSAYGDANNIVGKSTQGITFVIAGNPTLTTTMKVIIRNSANDAGGKAFLVPFPDGKSNYFAGGFRNLEISDTPGEITFSADTKLIARIVIDTTSKNADGSYNKGEVFDGSGVSVGTFSSADNAKIPESGMIDIFSRANNMYIKTLKVERVLSFDGLIARIAKAEGYQQSLFTSESFAPLSQALLSAQALMEQSEVTLEQIDSANLALDNAIAGLVHNSLFPENKEYVEVFSEDFSTALTPDKIASDWVIPYPTNTYMFAGDSYAKVSWMGGTAIAGSGSILVTAKNYQNYKLETNLKTTLPFGTSATLSLRNGEGDSIKNLRDGNLLERPGIEGIMIVLGSSSGLTTDQLAIVFKNGTLTQKAEYIVKYPSTVNITQNTNITVYDLDNKVYINVGGVPVARIELSGLVDGTYTSGSVYNCRNELVGDSFTGMVIKRAGRVGYSVRGGAYSIDINDIAISRVLEATQTVANTSFDKSEWGTGNSAGNKAKLGFIAGAGYTVNLSVKVDKSLGRSTLELKNEAGTVVDSKKIDCFFVTATWVSVKMTVPSKGKYTLEITADGSNYSEIADIQFKEGLGATTAGNGIEFDGVVINEGGIS